jgi:hypothetical protein
MLAWMNHTAAYASTRYQKRVYIKVHVSHGQTCSDYLDAHGQPINFNFLPQFALRELAVAPHTVQTYAFDDPAAGTYGNTNFSFMLEWASAQMRSGRRTIYYGETAYWVCNHYIYNCNIQRATHKHSTYGTNAIGLYGARSTVANTTAYSVCRTGVIYPTWACTQRRRRGASG